MQKHSSELPNTGFLRLPQVLAIIPIGKSTWWAGVASGRFPAPVRLGPRTTAWRTESIKKLIAELSGEKSEQDGGRHA
jgi:prophage regulatory protein